MLNKDKCYLTNVEIIFMFPPWCSAFQRTKGECYKNISKIEWWTAPDRGEWIQSVNLSHTHQQCPFWGWKNQWCMGVWASGPVHEIFWNPARNVVVIITGEGGPQLPGQQRSSIWLTAPATCWGSLTIVINTRITDRLTRIKTWREMLLRTGSVTGEKLVWLGFLLVCDQSM